jgi:hypothetical protein
MDINHLTVVYPPPTSSKNYNKHYFNLQYHGWTQDESGWSELQIKEFYDLLPSLHTYQGWASNVHRYIYRTHWTHNARLYIQNFWQTKGVIITVHKHTPSGSQLLYKPIKLETLMAQYSIYFHSTRDEPRWNYLAFTNQHSVLLCFWLTELIN